MTQMVESSSSFDNDYTKPVRMDRNLKRKQGYKIQEQVAVDLEKYFPGFKIFSSTTWGEDIIITNNEDVMITGEVKSCLELVYHRWRNRKTGKRHVNIRRGLFVISEHDLRCDFFVFVVKFVDEPGEWNGDIEVFYVKNEFLSEFSEGKFENKCREYHLAIDKIPVLQGTEDFENLKL